MKQILIAAAICIGLPAAAQQVNSELRFEKGKKLEMTYKSSSVSEAMGQSKMDITIIRSFDIEDIVNGNAVIEHKIKSIKFNVSSMMGDESFDSEKEDDMKGDIGKALERTLKSKYTMSVDPAGVVLSVTTDKDDNDKKLTQQDRMILGLIEQAAGKIAPPNVGDRTEFAVLPAQAVTTGLSWTDSSATKVSNYTVTSISENDVVISYEEKLASSQKQDLNGMTIDIVSNDSTSGQITLDRKTGLLKEKTANTTSEGSMGVMGQTMPMSSTSTKQWIVK